MPPIMAAHSSQPLAPGVKPGLQPKEEMTKFEKAIDQTAESIKPTTKQDEQQKSSPRPEPEKQLGGGVKKVPNKPKGKATKPKEVQGNLF